MEIPSVRPPEELLRLRPEEADELIDRLEAEVPVASGSFDLPGPPAVEAIVIGDTHGDWRSTQAAARRFLENPGEKCFVGLGDYIDRPPEDCPNGSVANLLYLLSLRAAYPDRVFLIQGNHETSRRFPVLPHSLPEEVDDLWGPEEDRYSRLMGLAERGGYAALSPGGAYLAHAGFPTEAPAREWRARLAEGADGPVLDVVWRSADASRIDRGFLPSFTERELESFLGEVGASVFLRGHDPDLTGRSSYHHRCLTIHTSRLYELYGGVLIARLPLDRAVRSSEDIRLEHLETEGRRSYPEP
ncbi:MAG: metallophosphoesterase [Thermoplasmata archaeon]|nr:metallophosphoesterase [Thermoplasmata archaeon]MCI4338265.1 metallophosphoesterase [Thermoplasmata archaeon]MCI4341067.1 metallophosphoesterase [Thermoplasmata archaeon]